MSAFSPAPRSLTRFLAAAVTAALLTAGGLLVASPASAHDELISSDPAAGSSVDALPAALTFTFSDDIATDALASEVQVTDAAGTSLTAGAPVPLDNVLTQPLEGEASGAITVLWKVVSSDGHPISGELSFTVTAAPTPTPTAEPTESASPIPVPTETVAPSPSASISPEDEDSTFADVWPWIIGAVLVAAVGGAVLYLLLSRARRQRDAEALKAGSEPPQGR